MRRICFAFITAAIVFCSIVAVAFFRDLANARERLAGRSSTIETSFGSMEYAEAGQGEPVLVIHGAGGGFDQALDMTGTLAGDEYRLIAPSRFGYLRSAMPLNATTEMQADAYSQLLDHLGLGKVDVVGISAGAWSAMQFAIRHPQRCRALVLLVPANYLPPGSSIHGGPVVKAIFNSDFVAWAAVKLMPVIPGGMTRMMLGTDPAVLHAASPSETARIRQILDHLLPVILRIKGMNFDVTTAAANEPYAVGKIDSPVLTISAEDDRFGTTSRAKYIAASVPHGRTIIYPTGGHALVGHYEDALRESISFLRSVQKAE
jgi:pimeloyl-ACP methyl ester carboxylesterase